MLSRLLLGAGLFRPAVAATACSAQLQRCWVATSDCSGSASPLGAADTPELTPEEQQHLDTLRYLIARPLEGAQNAALLTALAASYRDLYVVMDQFHKKDILGIPRPLLDEPPTASSSSSSSQDQQQSALAQQAFEHKEQLHQSQQQEQLNRTQMFYPLRDLTKLPDEPPKAGGFYRHHLKEKHMTSRGKGPVAKGATAYAQLLPNHLEVSYQVNAFIYLWPPMEMFYPHLFDPEYMLKHLKPHFKRTRVKKSQKAHKVRCSLGWRRNKPYHKQRVFGTPSVPAALQV